MTTTELVAAVLLRATGKAVTPTVGDTKWNRVVATANLMIDSWARERGVDWQSLYDPAFSLGTIQATDTYDLDDSIRHISDADGDTIRIIHTDPTVHTDYETIPANELKLYDTGNYCAVVGRTLRFNKPFTAADPQFGGTLTVPCSLFPDHLDTADSTVPVDDPNWLVVMAAAEYIRTDPLFKDQYPTLLAEANELMQGMIEANDAQVSQVHMPFTPLGATWS